MPKRVPPLNAMQVERIRQGEELIDGGVPGLRVTGTAAGLSWGLSVRVKGRRRHDPSRHRDWARRGSPKGQAIAPGDC